MEKSAAAKKVPQRFRSICAAQWPAEKFEEANMGKYVAYFLCIVVALIALEYFEIVDVPGFDLPDLQTKGEMIHEKSEENMKRRFGE